jgi:hypothetical protein
MRHRENRRDRTFCTGGGGNQRAARSASSTIGIGSCHRWADRRFPADQDRWGGCAYEARRHRDWEDGIGGVARGAWGWRQRGGARDLVAHRRRGERKRGVRRGQRRVRNRSAGFVPGLLSFYPWVHRFRNRTRGMQGTFAIFFLRVRWEAGRTNVNRTPPVDN